MKTKQFWYPLPTRLIAQHPSERRGDDRMMVLHRDTGMIEHRAVADLVEARFPKLDGKVLINNIGNLIGSHTGPGTVALFFWGSERVD